MTVPKETINIHFISQSKRIIFIFRFSDRNIKNRHKSTQQHDEQLEIGSVLHSSNFIPNIIVNTHIVRQLRTLEYDSLSLSDLCFLSLSFFVDCHVIVEGIRD